MTYSKSLDYISSYVDGLADVIRLGRMGVPEAVLLRKERLSRQCFEPAYRQTLLATGLTRLANAVRGMSVPPLT